MSKGKATEGKLADMAAMTTLGRAALAAEVPEPSVPELIARFQIDTESLIATMRKEHQGQISAQDRKVAALEDQWTAARSELAAIRGVVDEALHSIRQGVAEALNAQREAIAHAKKAGDSAAVFEKLKASQPDFHRLVGEVQKKLGQVEDKITHVEGTMSHLSKRIDEFELVAEDYQETKTTVRGLDPIVKVLDRDLSQRRTSGASR